MDFEPNYGTTDQSLPIHYGLVKNVLNQLGVDFQD
jgi:hypothetical protein